MKTRWIVVATTLVVALLVGCSSGSSDAGVGDSVVQTDPTADPVVDDTQPESDGDPVSSDDPADAATATDTSDPAASAPTGWVVAIIDPGAEPRVSLGGGDESQALITVSATESIDAAFGSFTQKDTFTGDYDLEITTRSRADGFDLITERIVRSLVIDDELPELSQIAGVVQSHTASGLPRPGITKQEIDYNRALRGLLSTPNLVLAVPDEAVGVGAKWTVPMDSRGEVLATVTLTSFTDTQVETVLSLDRSDDTGSFTMTAEGSYERATLLATVVTTESALSFMTQASENGEVVEVRNEQRSLRIYERASS